MLFRLIMSISLSQLVCPFEFFYEHPNSLKLDHPPPNVAVFDLCPTVVAYFRCAGLSSFHSHVGKIISDRALIMMKCTCEPGSELEGFVGRHVRLYCPLEVAAAVRPGHRKPGCSLAGRILG